ncbi:hypothetical protein [Streptomyces canus]|uniref:hypothetical protein n=1 Tax=Streptomyces canus TaxID=58343 RepID=UPI002783FBD9|nr:hypothetical protein [Streptomyces canus]MDQ0764654.1 hypothetical protein [Streptomyces canus]
MEGTAAIVFVHGLFSSFETWRDLGAESSAAPGLAQDLDTVADSLRSFLDGQPNPAARHDSLVFLQDLAKDLSRPVFHDGRKHRDRRPAQYLTDHFRQSTELNVEGVRSRKPRRVRARCDSSKGRKGCTTSTAVT